MSRVLGIDLGARSVKVAELDVGFRTVRLTRLRTFDVLEQPGTLERCVRAFGGNSPSDDPTDTVYVGVPGDRMLMRLLDVPFSDPRKLQAVIGNELADEVPWEIDEVIFSHLAGHDSGKVLAAVMRCDEIRTLLDELISLEIDPRALLASPLSYGELIHQLYPQQTVAVLDIGHMRTNVCLVANRQPLLARTISRAGHQITEQLRQTLQLGYFEAEQFKHNQALVVDDLEQLEPARQRVARVTAQAIAPMVREVKRTLSLAKQQLSVVPDRVVLCGGTAQLAGLDSYLSIELGVAVERLDLQRDPEGLGDAQIDDEGQLVGALSFALALEHGKRQRVVDFRQGEFAYKTDTSLLREKIVSFGVSALVMMIFAALSAYSALYALEGQKKVLDAELARATTRLFGKPVSDPSAVSRRLRVGSRQSSIGVPQMTAFDVLDRLSKRVPPKDEIKLDIARLDIKPGKVYVRGTADSQAAVGKLVKNLKGIDCFKTVTAGRISQVGEDKKQFTINVASACF